MVDTPPKTADTHASIPPLCIDLDGTVLHSDTLTEALAALATSQPLALPGVLWQLSAGRARFKNALAQRVTLDVATLPYHQGVLDFLAAERDSGRELVLVTAAPTAFAQAVADHLMLFDRVIASSADHNLKGSAKRDRLVAEYGEGGFDYMGDSAADIPVWQAARHALLVEPDTRVAARAKAHGNVARVWHDKPRGIKAYLKATRLHHWLKNLLLFVPLVAAHQLGNPMAVGQLVLAFLAFGLAASSVYLLNDLLDLGADRAHPQKCHRALAAGKVPLLHAGILIPLLPLAALIVALPLPTQFLTLLTVYYLCTLAYSMGLKRLIMVDVLTLGGLYSLRVMAGTAATGIMLSFWMFAFAMFLFLSLAMVKRHAELSRFKQVGMTLPGGRGYRLEDLNMLSSLGIACGYLAVLVMALYINSPDVTVLYAHPEWLWALCPLVTYWISRVWLLAGRGEMDEDPLLFALKDPASYFVGMLGAAALLYAS